MKAEGDRADPTSPPYKQAVSWLVRFLSRLRPAALVTRAGTSGLHLCSFLVPIWLLGAPPDPAGGPRPAVKQPSTPAKRSPASPARGSKPPAKPPAAKPPPRLVVPPRPRPGAPLATLPTRIELTARGASGEVRAAVGPGETPGATRPLLTIRHGESPRLQWKVINTDRRAPIESLAVHFLIVRIENAGEAIPPEPRKGSHADSVLGTEIPPGGKVEGSHNTAMFEPGVYLVEVELLDPAGNRRHYGVLEVKVTP